MEALYELIFRSLGPVLLVMAVSLFTIQSGAIDKLQMRVKEDMQENDGVYAQHESRSSEMIYDRDFLIGLVAGGFTKQTEINMQPSSYKGRVIFTPLTDGSVRVEHFEGLGAAEYIADEYVYRPGSMEVFDFSLIVPGTYSLNDEDGYFTYTWVDD